MPKITRVRTIRTRVNGGWVIVKVETDQPGLYGIGSASDWYQGDTVVAAIEHSLGPRLIGREAANVEDIWQSSYTSSYWRNGAVLNTALGGIDMALWLAGQIAGDEIAREVQLYVEYDPQPPYDSGSTSKAEPATVARLRAEAAARG